jgi:CRISPR-associated protein Cas2
MDVSKKIDPNYDSVIFYTWRSERYTRREIMGVERGNSDFLI